MQSDISLVEIIDETISIHNELIVYLFQMLSEHDDGARHVNPKQRARIKMVNELYPTDTKIDGTLVLVRISHTWTVKFDRHVLYRRWIFWTFYSLNIFFISMTAVE